MCVCMHIYDAYIIVLVIFTQQLLKQHLLCASTLSCTENTIYREGILHTRSK